ncbi:uncharacterized protein LOC132749670 [Ruditapes philippinarum]|uniref:uncharacterized protein LOC132749670 n=1 Tax=Ruditapes philippinarum TaxID=129788 RepID=UPI00295C3403|nr:uncharacterized protein LOC132749670 [Ruditapes philippinarum]
MASYHCCVPKCTNDSRYNKSHSFHSFPSDISRKKLWLVKIRRDEGAFFQVKPHTKVCSAHFTDTDFVRTLTGIRCLSKTAFPSVFDWSFETPSRKPPTPRLNSPKRKRLTLEDDKECNTDESQPQIMTPQPVFHDYLGPEREMSSEEKLKAASEHIDELEHLVERLTIGRFGLQRFATDPKSTDPKSLQFYTGFSSYTLLLNVYNLLRPTAEKMTRWSQIQRKRMGYSQEINTDISFRSESTPLIDQFFMFLVKIRLGLFQQDIACRFNVSQSTVSRIIITWANFMYFQLGSIPIWPSREKVNKFMPDCFKELYPSTRVILDCTEVKIQTPSALSLNSEFYSHYKGTTTLKGLIGISPSGCVTFVSSLFAGSISDQNITRQSGILPLIEPGDSVMADKGFLIEQMLAERQARLNIPPFLTKRDQFTKEEVEETQEIARLRIHVERAIRRIKEYHIFDSVLPVAITGSALQLWTVCCLLTLFKGPLF